MEHHNEPRTDISGELSFFDKNRGCPNKHDYYFRWRGYLHAVYCRCNCVDCLRELGEYGKAIMRSWCSVCLQTKPTEFIYQRTEEGLKVISKCQECGYTLETFRKWEPIPV